MPENPVPNDRWVILEQDIRETLRTYSIADELWLVIDLLQAFRMCLMASQLVTYETARKYYNSFPDRLHSHDATSEEIRLDQASQ